MEPSEIVGMVWKYSELISVEELIGPMTSTEGRGKR